MRKRIEKLLLLWRTIRWLKPAQIFGRLWFRLYRPRPRIFRDADISRPAQGWQATAHKPSMTGPDRFTFLNRTETLSVARDWNAPKLPKLWLYNAHYFDDLAASEAKQRSDWHRALITRWIAENPAGTGNGWEPYPTSLRIVNWAKWLLSGNAPPTGMSASLSAQADWLSRRLEHHLLGNHLFANAKALVFAGCIVDVPDAERWLATGLRLLEREVPEQVLPDGGHFERSVMYHAILTEDVLDLVQLGQLYPDKLDPKLTSAWKATAMNMLRFLEGMTHPDQRIAFFNDGAFGIAAEPNDLFAQAERLNLRPLPCSRGITRFKDTGYTRLAVGEATLLADTAPIGPDYLPGHAHADTLSFEFSLGHQRIFVNGGTSVYGGDPVQRHRERSTASHNTLCVNGQNSSEIWADFRVARRAKVGGVRAEQTGEVLWIEGSHDGYRRNGGPIHHRRWELTSTSLTIRDKLDRVCTSAKAYFRIHPDLEITTAQINGPKTIAIKAEGGTLTIENGTWSPEFGKLVPCKILVLTLDDLASSISFTWEP